MMARVLSVCSFAALLAVSAAGSCDGKDFACNHTDNKFIITNVYMESDTKVHWKAGDTVHIKMSGKVHNFDVTAGTLHYKVGWRQDFFQFISKFPPFRSRRHERYSRFFAHLPAYDIYT